VHLTANLLHSAALRLLRRARTQGRCLASTGSIIVIDQYCEAAG
jgi:hypothetical protein